MAGNNPSFVAGGNIAPSRFVKISADYTVVQAGSGDKPVGVSHEASHYPPGYLATFGATDAGYQGIAGRTMDRVYGDGEQCLLEVGEALGCNADDWLIPDANGRGVTATKGTKPGFHVQESCTASGTKVRGQFHA
jgi:hypothetical protein